MFNVYYTDADHIPKKKMPSQNSAKILVTCDTSYSACFLAYNMLKL